MSDMNHTNHDKPPTREKNTETPTAKTPEQTTAHAVVEPIEILDLLGEDDGAAGSCSDGSCSVPAQQS